MCSFSCRYVLLWYERLCVCVCGGCVCVCDFIVILTLFSSLNQKMCCCGQGNISFRLDSSVSRASAFGARGRGFESGGRTILKV